MASPSQGPCAAPAPPLDLTAPPAAPAPAGRDRQGNDDQVIIYSMGLVHASACAPATMTPAEVAERASIEQPTGVGPWTVSSEPFDAGHPNPTPCNTGPGRLHYLLTC